MKWSKMMVPLLLVAAGSIVVADERTWLKTTHVVTFDEEQLAQCSVISTGDEVQPRLLRILYGDSEGRLLVVRNELNSGSGSSSYTFVATGESIRFSWVPNGPVTFERIGGSSITFADEDRMSSEVRSQAAAVLAGASTSFKDALQDLAELGILHGDYLRTPGVILAELFYPDFLDRQEAGGEVRTGYVLHFDPNTTSPSTFEQQFGQAYYQ